MMNKKMNWKSIAVALGAALLVAPVALADMSAPEWILQSAALTPTGSWSVPISLDMSRVSSFDSLAVRITSPGDSFSQHGLEGFSRDAVGWNVVGMNREHNISVGSGQDARQVGVTLHFAGDPPTKSGDINIDVALFSGDSVVATAHGEWQDLSGNRYDRFYFAPGTWQPLIDELPSGLPPAVSTPGAVLLGLIGLGLTMLIKARVTAGH
jgi:hypothetical protein